MKKTAFILTVFILTWKISISQTDCDYIYTRQVIARPIVWNQFEINLELQLRGIKIQKDSIVMVLDTSSRMNWIIHNNYSLSESSLFALSSKDTIVKTKKQRIYSIENLSKNESKIFMTSYFAPDYFWYPELVQLKNSSLFYNTNIGGEREFMIFDYSDEKKYSIKSTSFGERIGNSDTSIFIQVDDRKAKISGSKFSKGKVVSISKNGAFIHSGKTLDYLSPLDGRVNSYSQFYNGTFLINRKYLKHERINCEDFYYYKYYIYKERSIIDSIECTQKGLGDGNLPEYSNNLGRLVIKNKDYLKIYSKDKMTYLWLNSYWSEKIEILKEAQYKEYLILGDTLYVITQNQTPLLLTDKTTLNKMALDSHSTNHQTILAFDILNNTFIGYPTIIVDK